jgi:hypothetical protein
VTVSPVLKDVIVPLVSPFVAAATAVAAWVLFDRQEKGKIEIKRKADFEDMLLSIRRDARRLGQMYEVFALMLKLNEPIERARIDVLTEIAKRVRKELLNDPRIFNQYFLNAGPRMRKSGPLLVDELQVRLLSSLAARKFDLFVLFGVDWLMYVHGADLDEMIDLWGAMEQIRNTNPKLYDPFMPDTQASATP